MTGLTVSEPNEEQEQEAEGHAEPCRLRFSLSTKQQLGSVEEDLLALSASSLPAAIARIPLLCALEQSPADVVYDIHYTGHAFHATPALFLRALNQYRRRLKYGRCKPSTGGSRAVSVDKGPLQPGLFAIEDRPTPAALGLDMGHQRNRQQYVRHMLNWLYEIDLGIKGPVPRAKYCAMRADFCLVGFEDLHDLQGRPVDLAAIHPQLLKGAALNTVYERLQSIERSSGSPVSDGIRFQRYDRRVLG